MRRVLSIALVVGCLVFISSGARKDKNKPWKRGGTGHPAACAKGCGCAALGISPKEHRVTTDQRAEIAADWRAQDGMIGGLNAEAIAKVVRSLEDPGELGAECDKLVNGKVAIDDPRWEKLYLAACEKRREHRLKPHLDKFKQIVFAKHYEFGGSHYAYTEGLSDAQHEAHFVPGASLCRLDMEGAYAKFSVLLDDPAGVIRDPDVSPDAKRVLFAWKKSADKDDYHLYEMELATKKIRQITSGLGHADYEPLYTGDGNIVFSSTRCIQAVDCWWTEVSNLFTCDKDGKYMRQIGFDQVHTTLPTLTHDGRVLYTRWDYNDRGQMAIQSLFQMNPDGTNQRELYGNSSCFPTTILHTRSIPGTGKYVCILSGHHSRQRGWLAIIDPRKGRQENQGAQLIAPVRETKAVVVDAACQSGNQFKHPYPLSENAHLVAFAFPEPNTRRNTIRSGTRPYGIYFMHSDGGRELLYKDNNISCTQPIPISPRKLPRRASTVDYTKKTGTIYMHDVYEGPGLTGVKRGTIKALRVVGLEFRPSARSGVPANAHARFTTVKDVPEIMTSKCEGLNFGHKNRGPISGGLVSNSVSLAGGTWDVKKVLGSAKVYEDGSACFEAPARTAIFFQAIDEKGHMVQSMRSWMTLQPGESVSCIGCHERKNEAPPVPYLSKALTAGAQTLDRTGFEGSPGGFDFKRDVQPTLDKHCRKCHKLSKDQKTDKVKKLAFSLKWPAAYNTLADRKYVNWINAQSKPPLLPPYYRGAAVSKLIKMLDSGHNKVKLSPDEMQRLIAWIDLGIPCLGDYTTPTNHYHRKKRRHWKTEETENIRQYLEREK